MGGNFNVVLPSRPNDGIRRERQLPPSKHERVKLTGTLPIRKIGSDAFLTVMSTDLPAPTHRLAARLPVSATLLALAPLHLPNQRKERYQGDDLCIPLTSLAARDQTLVLAIYEALGELLHTITDTSTDNASKWRDTARWTQRHNLDAFIDKVRELGAASHAEAASEELAKAMHDVRGGPLSPLLGRLQFLDHLPHDEDQLKTLFVLVRDHLKIMRSAITELDDLRRDADRRPRSHDMRLMLEKWHGSVVGPKPQAPPIHMNVDCRFEGTLTECCLESAAIDRIFYNLATNACRHAAGNHIDMAIFPIPELPGDCLRFVLSNEVSEADAISLKALIQSGGADSADKGTSLNLTALFAPTVSSTGSGFGLTVVTDLVTSAFGLPNSRETLRERYVGAILDGRTFRVWFHWPMARNDIPRHQINDFHRPEQSLDEP